MEKKELERLMEDAAEKGATKALHSLGLNDDSAYDDMRELRGLLETWRATKKTVGKTVTTVVTACILTALVTSVAMGWGNFN